MAAAAALLRGEMVVMPTETVYGLAGLMDRPEAIAAIFAAKGRPATNPLIVHIADAEAWNDLAMEIPPSGWELARRFWPGPLTLVARKRPRVPDTVTAGGDTVAVRVPAHPIALALLREVQAPVCAPSANPSNQLSPTQVSMLDPRIRAAASVVLDGGSCEVGLESTVVDLTGPEPVILRPGVLTAQDLGLAVVELPPGPGALRSPGMLRKHYAPAAKVRIATGGRSEPGISFGHPLFRTDTDLSDDPRHAARGLYSALRAWDRGPDCEIWVDAPPSGAAWDAIRDRLTRAASD